MGEQRALTDEAGCGVDKGQMRYWEPLDVGTAVQLPLVRPVRVAADGPDLGRGAGHEVDHLGA